MHQYHFRMNTRGEVKTEFTGFHGIIRKIYRYQDLITTTLLICFLRFFFQDIIRQPG
ncbi:unknown [Phocaeicola coprophilus CAG:333]|nr:unknown [Phocaeicola coprophilus CAG:333]